jgi:hypothetical protein
MTCEIDYEHDACKVVEKHTLCSGKTCLSTAVHAASRFDFSIAEISLVGFVTTVYADEHD